jgi:predicted type IV restriction endonuclease
VFICYWATSPVKHHLILIFEKYLFRYMISKDAAYKIVEDLVIRFEEQIVSYKKSDYNETQTRRDFIDPFFKALGWDMDNSQGNAEAYREVIHEDKVKVGAATKAPDYSFKLAGGKRLFFVEAKKPSVAVKEEIMPAYQIRRYAFSAKLPISILTDFEEFAIYDCNKKPIATDKPSVGRVKYLTYKEYLNEFDFIWDTFSKERVLKGSFDKFIAADKNKKGTTTVDKEFLISLDEWRKQLALNIALRNEALNEDELNFVVQQTLDRLIFLRIAEDRGVEEYGRLQNLLKGENFYQNLFTYFKEADSKYNSGLFDFKKDTISFNVAMDNKTIKGIINELYYPISPYEFSVLSVEILGSAYEQFLGKQIKLTAGHRAIIEEKPEVRKAGGVYYTPQYIVEYIVENTVGKLTTGKKPADVAKLKIVDPACGSGSFLLGAYQYLLNWHLQFYKPGFEKQTAIAQNSKDYNEKQRNEALKERNKLPLTPTGNLTTALKKQILLNNIYGVDIDTQAVEVTKLSLLLKCMEGETGSSITAEMRFGERILPTLENNIKSGNSLIDMDFYDGQIDFEPALEKKVKPFSWQKGFADVFKQGGFDAVIGNPPWGADLNEPERNYLSKIYQLVPSKTKDTYFYFLFKSFKLIKKNALIGLVLPNTWLLINNANLVRGYLLKHETIEIIDYGDSVFKDAIVETTTIIIKNKSDENGTCRVKRFKKSVLVVDQIIEKELWVKDPLNRIVIDTDKNFDKFYDKILKVSSDFSTDCEIIFGIKPYQLGHGKPPQTKDIIEKRIFHSETKHDKYWKPLLTGTNINRYFLGDPGNQFIKYGEWLMYKSNEVKMVGEKIFLRRTSDTIRASYDDKSYYGQNSLFVITSKTINLKFLLGILNSSLINYIYKKKCPQVGKVFAEIKPSIIKELPIKKIDSKNKTEKFLHDEIVKLVETMLQLQQQKQSSTLPNQLHQVEQRIAYTDDKINEKVYSLYGLSAEEVKVIENRN